MDYVSVNVSVINQQTWSLLWWLYLFFWPALPSKSPPTTSTSTSVKTVSTFARFSMIVTLRTHFVRPHRNRIISYTFDGKSCCFLEQYWTRLQQSDSSDGSAEQYLNGAAHQNTDNFNNFPRNNKDDFQLPSIDRSRQSSQNGDVYLGSSQALSEQQQLRKSQNQFAANVAGQSSDGLATLMVEKIVAIQKIAVDHHISNSCGLLDAALAVNQNSVKIPKHNFVSFSNATMKYLDDGHLEFMYLNPEKDTVFAQYQFDKVETVGSFKSNIEHAHSGTFTILLDNVRSNLSTGFYDNKHAVVKAAKFRYADANIKTHDGSETQVFSPALEQKYLGVLANAVSGEVMKSSNQGALVQIINEMRKPIVPRMNANKLFDMSWQEDSVSIKMADIGFQNSKFATFEQFLKSVTFQRKSQDSYMMCYDLALDNLEWNSAVTIMSAGKITTTEPINFNMETLKIQVYIAKSANDQQQQSYGKASTNVEVRGLHYNLNKRLQSELVSNFENNLQRFIELSLESYFQNSLVQELIKSSRQY